MTHLACQITTWLHFTQGCIDDKHHRHHRHKSKAEIKELLKKAETAVVELETVTDAMLVAKKHSEEHRGTMTRMAADLEKERVLEKELSMKLSEKEHELEAFKKRINDKDCPVWDSGATNDTLLHSA